MYKLEVYVVDFEGHGLKDIEITLEQNRYYSFNVKKAEEADIGEWTDDHPVNFQNTPLSKYRSYFKDIKDLVFRLRERARIRRQIPTRKSVQEGKSDRISDLLEEAANALENP